MTDITRRMTSKGSSKELYDFMKSMLVSEIFVGTFVGNRWVEELGEYRNLICIENTEHQFIENLTAAINKLKSDMLIKKWIGISPPGLTDYPNNYCLWVELPNAIIGKHWYSVSKVEMFDNEVRLRLKQLRSFDESNSSVNLSSSSENSFLNWNLEDYWEQTKDFLKQNVTKENIKGSIIFISFFVLTTGNLLFTLIKSTVEITLQFMDKLTNLIHALEPVMTTCLRETGKVLQLFLYGIFNTLQRLMFSKPSISRVQQYPQNMIYYRDPRFNQDYRAIGYKSSVKITPLDD